MSLLLAGGTVVTSLDAPGVLRADVLVEADRVTAVGPSPVGGSNGSRIGSDGLETIDCSGCLIVPGNVCAHTHVYSTLARGMPQRLEPPRDFLDILRRLWWRLDRALDPESIAASAAVGAMEALLAGTTTLVDHHASPNAIDGSLDVIAGAFERLGLRSVLAYEVTDRDGPGPALAGLAENERFLRATKAGDRPLARGMVGAHASFTLSDRTLARCVAAAHEFGTGIHIHAAEDAIDERDAMANHGRRVIGRLANADALDGRTLLAHAVHLDEEEAELVVTSGATVAHNPRSNMNNGVGRAPLRLLGARVALGTDGIGADMFEESRLGYLRLRDGGDDPALDWPLDRLAEGSRLVGRVFDEPRFGLIEPGAPADLVVLDYPAPTPLTPETLAGHWLFGLSARTVRDVVVAGRVVVADRRLTTADGSRIAATAREVADRLWRRMNALDEHPYRPAGLAVR
jgi:putative selenium metabolism protein SsnA